MESRPMIAITMGDPCGIGPEVVAKALSHPSVHLWCNPIVIGNQEVLKANLVSIGSSLELVRVDTPQAHLGSSETVQILDPGNLDAGLVEKGTLSKTAGHASMQWVLQAGNLCLDGSVTGMATAPINKEATRLAGYEDIGHMEVLQRLSGSKNVATMLISGTLRVVHLTTHRSLRLACDAVTKDNVLDKIRLTHTSFREWGFSNPRIAVAALNPHGSDGGLIGDEENEHILPAVITARETGIMVVGPIPADTVFHQAIRGQFDVVIAMYHDQGHIPVKVHGFEESVTINLGLPFTRTSVDHGTAFDIAGKGIADSTSMVESIRLAATIGAGKGLEQLVSY
jgi:4-hydroxythreonine-4-phosphate dehydrogenase